MAGELHAILHHVEFLRVSADCDLIAYTRLVRRDVHLAAVDGYVSVTHELASIFAVGDNSVFLDVESKTQIAVGHPRQLLADCPDPKVQRFLRRGETAPAPLSTLAEAS